MVSAEPTVYCALCGNPRVTVSRGEPLLREPPRYRVTRGTPFRAFGGSPPVNPRKLVPRFRRTPVAPPIREPPPLTSSRRGTPVRLQTSTTPRNIGAFAVSAVRVGVPPPPDARPPQISDLTGGEQGVWGSKGVARGSPPRKAVGVHGWATPEFRRVSDTFSHRGCGFICF